MIHNSTQRYIYFSPYCTMNKSFAVYYILFIYFISAIQNKKEQIILR